MKRIIYFFVCTLLLISCGGGGDGGGGDTPSGGSEYLNVPKDLVVGQGNTTTTLQISASQGLDWSVSSDQSWVSFSQKNGRGSANITVTVTTNPSSSTARTANITVSSKSYTRTCELKQEPNAAYLDLSVSSLTFTNTGGTQQVTITSNTDWTIVEPDEDWVTVSPRAKTSESTVVSVQVKENTTEAQLRKTFTIKGGNVTKQLEVVQTGRSTDFNVTPTTINANATAGTVEFNIVGEARWTAKSNQNWATLSEESGEGNKTISVTLQDNQSDQGRSADITISSSSKSVTITVTQSAGSIPVISEIRQSDITNIEQDKATLTFKFTSMFNVTEYGVCFSSTNQNPTTSDKVVTKQAGNIKDGTPTMEMTGLSAGTTYYVRAYVTNGVGTQYSNAISFTTVSNVPGGGDNETPDV